VGVHPEDEPDVLTVPSIQMGAVGEVGVAAEGDPAGVGLYQGDGPVDPLNAALMTGCVAGAVHQIENLLGVGQGYDKRRITPDPLVRDVHALFALAESPGDRSIHIVVGLVEEPSG
jgi:hypothetical protein